MLTLFTEVKEGVGSCRGRSEKRRPVLVDAVEVTEVADEKQLAASVLLLTKQLSQDEEPDLGAKVFLKNCWVVFSSAN